MSRLSIGKKKAGGSKSFGFAELADAPLIVDAVYEGGVSGNIGDDPLTKLIPGCSHQGGFRVVGPRDIGRCKILVLSSSGTDPDWPDRIDAETGIFTYYGDNKKPGHELHVTPKGGNRMLNSLFDCAYTFQGRSNVPPILIFMKTGSSRDVVFRGLVVPHILGDAGLVAIWRQTLGRRFQNYKANFAIIDCREVSRSWLNALATGNVIASAKTAPKEWMQWVKKGTPKLLRAPKTISYRTKAEQLPPSSDKVALLIISTILELVENDPYDFEFLAAAIFQIIEPRLFDLEITRKSVDGGRDATGRLRLGGEDGESDAIYVDFALEAKANAITNGVGVKATSRLISRLRHRQFGIIITTSYVGLQAYKELRQDNHPVVIIAGADIARILRRRGFVNRQDVLSWGENILGADRVRSC